MSLSPSSSSSQQFTADASDVQQDPPEFVSEPSTSPESFIDASEPSTSPESFIDDALRRFRIFLLGVPALAGLHAQMEKAAALPQVASLAAIRALTADVTLAILVGEPYERDVAATALVVRLSAQHGVDLSAVTSTELTRVERWIALFASYFADLEIA
jgi:hypothetical protein